ncbi:putative cytochrome P450 135B1 [Streptosporangium violaceochromogenes]|nr:putative cytochrome P450 135B1 [Streptosporangium violaceochromogenes]
MYARDRGLPPGPAAPAIVQSVRLLRAPYRFLDACAARFGDMFTLNLIGFGRFVLVSDPEAVRRVFVAGPDVLVAGKARAMLEPIFGQRSIMVLDGPEHSRQRRFLMPHLHRDSLPLGQAAAIEAARREIRSWPRGVTFPLYPRLESIATDVIIERFLGLDGHARGAEVKGLLLDFLRAAHAFPVFHLPSLVGRLDVGPWRRFRRLRRKLDGVLYEEMAARAPGARDAPGRDLFTLFAGAQEDSGRTAGVAETRDVVVSVIVAGHETVAIALAWALELILSHPDVEGELRAEIGRVTGGEGVRPEHLEGMTFLDAVIMESMRLRPINPIIPRLVTVPMELGGRVIPAGVHVAANSHGAHRRAASFPDPAAFRPQRFLHGRPDPFAWIPFGGGARKCIGMAFAQNEMKAVLATVLSECAPRLVPARTRRETSVGDMAAPSGGVRCRLPAV